LGWVGNTDVIGRVASTGLTVAVGVLVPGWVAFWFWTGGGAGGAPHTLNDVTPNMVAIHAASGFNASFIQLPVARYAVLFRRSPPGFSGFFKIRLNKRFQLILWIFFGQQTAIDNCQ
jgi:hypothetical protein